MLSSNSIFDEWIKKIERNHPRTIALGLDRLFQVADRANLCELPCPTIMVAGTNGKGSTVASLSRLLIQVGLNVGTYTSPHLLHFSERIQINAAAISTDILCEVFEKIESLRQETPLTFFEFTTLAALFIFKDPAYSLDVVILEVGLGGRLDAVNLVPADLAIVTSIGLDHQEWLGETVEEIAFEKAGIFRQNIPVILGKNANVSTLLALTKSLDNQVYLEGADFDFDPVLNQWRFQQQIINLSNICLPPSSVSIALAAYTILRNSHFTLPNLQEMSNCLSHITMVGRAHCMKIREKTVMLDVAHNAPAAVWLAEKVEKIKQKGKILAVWASLADKDLTAISAPFKDLIESWYIGSLHVERAASTQELYNILTIHQVKKIVVLPTITQAFEKALECADENDVVIVFGSFYTVAQVLEKYNFQQPLLENNGLLIASCGVV